MINTNIATFYVSAIVDSYDGFVQGLAISKNQDTELVVNSLKSVINIEPDKRKDIILHTDRGSQYTSMLYNRLLEKNNIVHSMSRPGKCPDNSPIERFWGELKCEKFNIEKVRFKSEKEFIFFVEDYINFYNTSRISVNLDKKLERFNHFLV